MMEIVYRNLSELKPNPNNPRKVEPGGVEELAESIKGNPAFFEARPILLSNRTGELVIIGGERRKEAAQLLGMKKVPTILIGHSVGKESSCNSGDPGSTPGLGRSTGEGIGYPLQYSWTSLVA